MPSPAIAFQALAAIAVDAMQPPYSALIPMSSKFSGNGVSGYDRTELYRFPPLTLV